MQHILVIWNYDNPQHSVLDSVLNSVLDKAIAMAVPFGAKISMAVFGAPRPGREAREAVQAIIAAALARQPAPKLKVSIEFVAHPDIAEWTSQTVASRAIALVIKTGDYSRKVFHTPTDWKLIRQLTCPLLICSPKKWKSKPCILATVDVASRNALQQTINGKVLDMAQQLAVAGHSKLHVAYTIAIAKALDALVITEPPEVMRKKGVAATKKLHNLLEQHGTSADAAHVTAGDPVKEIASIAKKIKAELVIMGSVGRKGVKGKLLGNTAENIIKNLRTDLLIIKP